MAEPLTIARFAALAEAYGGLAHWPEEVREEARRLAIQPEYAAILAEAEALDAHLDSWKAEAPSAGLQAAVLARRPRPARYRLRLWWAAAGVATALAGAAAGSLAAAAVPADRPAGDETAFGNLSAQEE